MPDSISEKTVKLNTRRLQLMVPRKMRYILLREFHENVAGHWVVSKAQRDVQKRGYWYAGGNARVFFSVGHASPTTCTTEAHPRHRRLQDMRTGAPMERLHVNLAGSFPRSEATGMTSICTCVCAFTRYAATIPIPDKSSVTVERAILEHIILRPILTDIGREFENARFREL